MASWAGQDPKPAKRVKASKAEWGRILRHFKGSCCVATGLPYQHLHHIVFRSESGDDILENLAPLTNEAHDRFHGRAPGWEQVAASIRQYVLVNNARRRYVTEKLGGKFGRRYPCLPNTDPQFASDFRVISDLQWPTQSLGDIEKTRCG